MIEKKIFLFFTLIILTFMSCRKKQTLPSSNELEYEIRLYSISSGETSYSRTTKYLPNGMPSAVVDFDGITEYSYVNNSEIPSTINFISNNTGGHYRYFDYKNSILTDSAVGDIAIYITRYQLNSNFTPLYIFNEFNDTIATYSYNNGKLITVNYSTSKDSLIYNLEGQLIKVDKYSNQTIQNSIQYEYSGNNWTGYSSNNYEIIYSYLNDNTLSKIIFIQNSNTQSASVQEYYIDKYKYFKPFNMAPINYYLYPYLHLSKIQPFY